MHFLLQAAILEIKKYIDMLPSTFGNSLWFFEDKLLDLRGITLFKAIELQVVA
ncbi:hypothetical protein HanIR_Chr02g0098031 [Helianthus annuus]|nr:hypothetical protein HanIR_Chr02g0098031 [Helianthus annuus]